MVSEDMKILTIKFEVHLSKTLIKKQLCNYIKAHFKHACSHTLILQIVENLVFLSLLILNKVMLASCFANVLLGKIYIEQPYTACSELGIRDFM